MYTKNFIMENLKKNLILTGYFQKLKITQTQTFIIPKCFNCNELLRKEDLEVLAEKLSTFEVADSIYKFYGKSLVQM